MIKSIDKPNCLSGTETFQSGNEAHGKASVKMCLFAPSLSD